MVGYVIDFGLFVFVELLCLLSIWLICFGWACFALCLFGVWLLTMGFVGFACLFCGFGYVASLNRLFLFNDSLFGPVCVLVQIVCCCFYLFLFVDYFVGRLWVDCLRFVLLVLLFCMVFMVCHRCLHICFDIGVDCWCFDSICLRMSW